MESEILIILKAFVTLVVNWVFFTNTITFLLVFSYVDFALNMTSSFSFTQMNAIICSWIFGLLYSFYWVFNSTKSNSRNALVFEKLYTFENLFTARGSKSRLQFFQVLLSIGLSSGFSLYFFGLWYEDSGVFLLVPLVLIQFTAVMALINLVIQRLYDLRLNSYMVILLFIPLINSIFLAFLCVKSRRET